MRHLGRLTVLFAASLAGCGEEVAPPSQVAPDPAPVEPDEPTEPPEPTEPTYTCMASACWTPPAAEGSHIYAGLTLTSGGDLQSDGFEDLLIPSPGLWNSPVGVVWMVHGAADMEGFAPASRWVSTGLGPDNFGVHSSLAGDLTGNGAGDVLAITMDGLSGIRGYVLEGPLDADGTGEQAAAHVLNEQHWVAGMSGYPDINGDNLDEVLVFWWGRSDYETHTTISVYESPLAPVLRAGGESFGIMMPSDRIARVSEPGDMDGDGIPEVLAPSGRPGSAAIYLHTLLPGMLQYDDLEHPTWSGTEHIESFSWARIAGDWDGDGYRDAWAGATTAGPAEHGGTAWLLFGPPTNAADLDHSPRIDGDDFEWMGTHAYAADLDGDGQDDLIVSAPGDMYYSTLPGRVYVFLGPIPRANLSPTDADYIWEGEYPADSFGQGLAVGDFDGDGLHDIAVGAPRSDEVNIDAGKVYLFLGKDL